MHSCCRYNGVVQGLNVQLADAHSRLEEQEAREQSKVWTQVWIISVMFVQYLCGPGMVRNVTRSAASINLET